jgi:hypothetical protein
LSLRDRFARELEELSTVSTSRQMTLLSRLRAFEAFPEQDYFEDKTVLVFEKKFTAGSHAFTYAAIKMQDHWYLSGSHDGRGGGRFTWETLVEWLAGVGEPVTQVFQATTFEVVIPAPEEQTSARHCSVCGGADHNKRSCPNG